MHELSSLSQYHRGNSDIFFSSIFHVWLDIKNTQVQGLLLFDFAVFEDFTFVRGNFKATTSLHTLGTDTNCLLENLPKGGFSKEARAIMSET